MSEEEKKKQQFVSRWGDSELDDVGYLHIPGYILRWYHGFYCTDDMLNSDETIKHEMGSRVGITPQEFTFICHVMSFKYDTANGQARPSLETIAYRMGRTWQSVYRLKKSLEEKGALTTTSIPGKPSVYTFTNLVAQCRMLEAINKNHTPNKNDSSTPNKNDRSPLTKMIDEDSEVSKNKDTKDIAGKQVSSVGDGEKENETIHSELDKYLDNRVRESVNEIMDNCPTIQLYGECAAHNDNELACMGCEWQDELPDVEAASTDTVVNCKCGNPGSCVDCKSPELTMIEADRILFSNAEGSAEPGEFGGEDCYCELVDATKMSSGFVVECSECKGFKVGAFYWKVGDVFVCSDCYYSKPKYKRGDGCKCKDKLDDNDKTYPYSLDPEHYEEFYGHNDNPVDIHCAGCKEDLVVDKFYQHKDVDYVLCPKCFDKLKDKSDGECPNCGRVPELPLIEEHHLKAGYFCHHCVGQAYAELFNELKLQEQHYKLLAIAYVTGRVNMDGKNTNTPNLPALGQLASEGLLYNHANWKHYKLTDAGKAMCNNATSELLKEIEDQRDTQERLKAAKDRAKNSPVKTSKYKELFAAISEALPGDSSKRTKSSNSVIGKATKELLEVEALPDVMKALYAYCKKRFDGDVTAMCMSKYYAEFLDSELHKQYLFDKKNAQVIPENKSEFIPMTDEQLKAIEKAKEELLKNVSSSTSKE